MDSFNFEGYPPEFLQAFSLPEEHPVRKGIMYALNEAMKSESFGVAPPGMSDSDRHYLAGRLAMVQDMFFGFENLFKDANKHTP